MLRWRRDKDARWAKTAFKMAVGTILVGTAVPAILLGPRAWLAESDSFVAGFAFVTLMYFGVILFIRMLQHRRGSGGDKSSSTG